MKQYSNWIWNSYDFIKLCDLSFSHESSYQALREFLNFKINIQIPYR